MVADGAHIWSLRAYDDVAAITAFPHFDLALFEYSGGFNVVQQRAVTLFVVLLDGTNLTELFGELGEALFFSRLGELVVHVGPLEVLAISSSGKVFRRVANAFELAEPHLGVILLIRRSFAEDFGDLLVAFALRDRREVRVFIGRLRLASERSLQVFLR